MLSVLITTITKSEMVRKLLEMEFFYALACDLIFVYQSQLSKSKRTNLI